MALVVEEAELVAAFAGNRVACCDVAAASEASTY